MPILKFQAAHCSPANTLCGLLSPDMAIAQGCQSIISGEPREMAAQMMQTVRLYRKNESLSGRTYYHFEIYFDPADLLCNGGTLDAEKANLYAGKYAEESWPDHEVVWAVHDHGPGIHIHFIVAAFSLETGRKMNIRMDEYQALRVRTQSLAREYGLSALDQKI